MDGRFERTAEYSREAIDLLEKARTIDPGDSVSGLLCDGYSRAGRIEQALAIYETLMRISSTNSAAACRWESRPMPLAIGTKLGLYEILAPIGAGGMGEVYRAKDTKLKRDVALKVLPGEVK